MFLPEVLGSPECPPTTFTLSCSATGTTTECLFYNYPMPVVHDAQFSGEN